MAGRHWESFDDRRDYSVRVGADDQLPFRPSHVKPIRLHKRHRPLLLDILLPLTYEGRIDWTELRWMVVLTLMLAIWIWVALLSLEVLR